MHSEPAASVRGCRPALHARQVTHHVKRYGLLDSCHCRTLSISSSRANSSTLVMCLPETDSLVTGIFRTGVRSMNTSRLPVSLISMRRRRHAAEVLGVHGEDEEDLF